MPTSGDTLTIHRGDDYTKTFTALGDISNRSKLFFTIKARAGDPSDSSSVIQILDYSGTDIDSDLIAVQGGSATDTSNGTITVDDESAGDITVSINAVETAKLDVAVRLVYDIQVIRTTGAVSTLLVGMAHIDEDVTKATS
jgi:hypothetical protein